MTTIQAGLTYYKQVNEKVREAAEKDDSITIENVIGQRYIGCGSSGKNITVHGTPGNGLGQYLNAGNPCRVIREITPEDKNKYRRL